ncbi:phosphate signaling complex protein PhoU [Streptococcus marimammalium]|uniref:phosphate signaling complex protein PhoU n=1 Tax=Streptococcus marimammalium TaxID=269666 RepID=UPI000371BCF5|nr:phosphate signaling complex protein PhoU [Streptococcus marimammalium]
MRSKFENQLHNLTNDLIVMGTFCEDIISKSLHCLLEQDYVLATDITKIYQKMEHLERDIESKCLKLLLQQQPVAKDLRDISAALKMVYDMKRIGAQSSEIAEIVLQKHINTDEELLSLEKMSTDVIEMVSQSIDAFIYQDQKLAHNIIEKDSQVDKEFDTIKIKLMDYFAKEASDGEHAIDLLMVAKYIERIGDHAVNIAKWVLFSMTGQL